MSSFADYLSSGHAWLYIPVAILLGALHGLEPGHSKTMMAAFIIAIRGTVWQAVLLGLSAAISHSLLIWVLAALALHFGGQWNADHTEPYFHLASAVLVFGLAVWMYLRTRREVAEAHAHSALDMSVKPDTSDLSDSWNTAVHTHSTAPRLLAGETVTAGGLILPAGMGAPAAAPTHNIKEGPYGGMLLDTGHGWLEVCIFETGVPPRFRIYPCKASGDPVPLPKGTQLGIETARLDGRVQKFAFEPQGTFWEATSELPEPHEFLATVSLGHSDHAHIYRLRFTEAHHGHGHAPLAVEEPEDDGIEYQDAHERAHAQDIAKRFTNRTVTTPQIVLFGITGGLMPCPAAFTILVVCLQIKKVALGFSLVAAFSFGLALTMVIVGAMAAWSINHAEKRFTGFGEWMRRAPYLSCALLVILAAFMAWQGWQGLSQPHSH
jgi:nickel/cobalt transporter (NicO) family protein